MNKDDRVVAGRITPSLEPYMLRLYPLLEKQERGETLELSELERESGTTVERHPGIVGRVCSWFSRRGIRTAMRGRAIYLLTAAEQAVQAPAGDIKRMRRGAARAHARIIAVSPTDLRDPKDRAKQEHLADLTHTLHAHAVGAAKEAGFVLTGKPSVSRLGE